MFKRVVQGRPSLEISNMQLDYKNTVPEDWRKRLNWDSLLEDLKGQIGRFGLWSYTLGQHLLSEMAEIKYDGRLIVLEDGTRWEVDRHTEGVRPPRLATSLARTRDSWPRCSTGNTMALRWGEQCSAVSSSTRMQPQCLR